MPGVGEINKVLSALQPFDNRNGKGKRLKLMSLHGNMSAYEQKSVFALAGKNEVKVVVSTNVAEASVTIPDVRNICISIFLKYFS